MSESLDTSDNLTQAIRESIWFEINTKLHTAIPAIVTKYDSTGPKVEAKPLIKRKFNDGTELSFKSIVEVPIMFPRTNRFRLTFPIEKGDTVLIIFCERSIETWLKTNEEQTPVNNMKYSLNNAIAIPGLFAFGKGSQINNGSKVEIAFDNANIIFDGEIIELNGDTSFATKFDEFKIMLDQFQTITSAAIAAAGVTGGAASAAYDIAYAAMSGVINNVKSTKNKLG